MNDSFSKTFSASIPDVADNPDISYHITRVRVPLFEVDLGQAVYHGNYFHLFELGREDFLRHIGFAYREFMARQLHLAVVESRCNYRKSVRYDELIEIHTTITLMRTRSLAFSQMVFRQTDADEGEINTAGKELCTQVKMNMVCVKFSGQPTVLPEEFRKAAQAYGK